MARSTLDPGLPDLSLPREGNDLSTRNELLRMAWFARLAPSTHNTVPVRFSLREADGALDFWVDRAAVLSESDPTGRQATVSLGCSIENASLAAACDGMGAGLTVLDGVQASIKPARDSEERHVKVATLTLGRPVERLSPDWLRAMKERRTVRAEYDDRVKLDPELADALVDAVSTIDPRLTLHLVADDPTRLFLGKLQELADTTVVNRSAFARELGEWLLPNDSEASVGMRGREFGLSDDAARRIHQGLLGIERLLPDEIAAFAKAGYLGMRGASAIALISVARDEVEQRVAAGRAYERLVLILARRGFCTAMHAALTEVEVASLALRGRLRTMHRPTVVFRIGQPLRRQDGERPPSSRPSLESLFLHPVG